MTGKYIQFEHGDVVLKTKIVFMEITGISKSVLERLKGTYKEGTIEWNGIKWEFKTIYKNLGQREYIPNPKGIRSKNKITTKVIGHLEFTYRGDTLIKTRSVA